MTRVLLLALSILGSAPFGLAAAQEPAMADTIDYVLGWDNPATQLYVVRVTARAESEPLIFSLPAWRPGRYILQNYAANVQNVRAEDGAGRPLAVEWLDLDSWRVDTKGSDRVTLTYEYYATTFDGGASILRPDLAYFNPVNLLPWVEGRMEHPAQLTLEAPAEWQVATQLERLPGAGHVFGAADYHALVDAPTIASQDLVDWPFDVDGVAFHAVFRPEPDLQGYNRDQVLADLAALAREQGAIFGGFPFDEYRHLYQFVPTPFGHAVEHASSASYVMGPPERIFADRDGYWGFLSVSAHELFHAWNVKRIRPAALWPYDYSRPQLTRLHWWTEGVTEYYSGLVLARAGLITQDEYWGELRRQIENFQNTPGRRVTSASHSSWTAWLTGYGAGHPNQSVSFYSQGSLLGLLLDLKIRDATDGARGLDDVFRLLWEEYYQEGQGVPEDGIARAVEAVAGRSFDDFFARHIHGTQEYPFTETLALAGLDARQVEVEGRPEATVGVVLRAQGDAVTVANVLPDGPAMAAGVMRGDIVLAVDGEELEGPSLDPILARHRPGDSIAVSLQRGGQEIVVGVEVELAEGGNLRWEVRPMESPSERQLQLREGWIAPKAGS
jgi:predicted metalloprotease with PDZ domain